MERTMTLVMYVVLGVVCIGLLLNYAVSSLGPPKPPVINVSDDDRGVLMPAPLCSTIQCESTDVSKMDCVVPSCKGDACLADSKPRSVNAPCKTELGEDGVCDGAGYCILQTCTDARDNATVCAGWVCGQRRDDCNVFRDCGVCSAPTTCDFAGSCIAPPPAIVSILETNRKLIPIMTSWGAGPISSWGYYSGLYVKGDLLITDEAVPAGIIMNPPGAPGPGCKFGGRCVLSGNYQQLEYTVAFRLADPLAPTRLPLKLPVDGRYTIGDSGGMLYAADVAYNAAGDFILTNTQQGRILPYASNLGYSPRPKGVFDPALGPTINPPYLYRILPGDEMNGEQGQTYALREVGGKTLAVINQQGFGRVCDLTRFRAGQQPADEYGQITCEPPGDGFLQEFFAQEMIVGDEYVYAVSRSSPTRGTFNRILRVYDFHTRQPLDSIELSPSNVDTLKLTTLDNPAGGYVFLYGESSDPPAPYSILYAYKFEGETLVPIATGLRIEGRTMVAMIPIVVDGNILLLSPGPTLHIYALDDLKNGIVRNIYAGDSTVLETVHGYFAKKGHYPLMAAYMKDDTAYVYLPAKYPSCVGGEPSCIESNLQVWTFSPESITR